MKKVNRLRGFTLIELMITVSIIIVIAAIAIPNYRGHVLRSNRSDAQAALMRVAAAQEKFYLQNNTYTADLTDSGLNIGTASANEHYNLTVSNADLEGFDATATATGAQAKDTLCSSFGLDEQGLRSARALDGDTDNTEQCWR